MSGDDFSRRESFGFLTSAAMAPNTVSSTSDEPGTKARAQPGRVSVVQFGARGDGVTDDTAAFQKALDTGLDVWVPGTSQFYLLRRTLATRSQGQSLTGDGRASYLVQTATGSNATVITVRHDDCTISDVRLKAGDGGPPLYDGWGVLVSRTARCTVARCWFDGIRRGGVLVHASAHCRVHENRFVDSVLHADGTVPQSKMGYDILIAGASSHNFVANNECSSGCGVGIGCQTVVDGDSQDNNIIDNNVVRNHPCYGIMIYLSGSRGKISGVTISGNRIFEISGSVKTDGTTYFYGAGIYVQTANNFLISNNYIDRTNVDRRLPPSGSAVPAAIAVSGCGNGTITGNILLNCLDGIASIQATGAVPEGEGTIISSNVINNCDRIGINLLDCAAAIVVGNRLAGGGRAAHGIFVSQTGNAAQLFDFTISNNAVHHFHAGIEVLGDAIQRAIISNNTVTNVIGYAIASGAGTSIITGNITQDGGIAVRASAQYGTCRDNVITSGATDAIARDQASGVAVSENIFVRAARKAP